MEFFVYSRHAIESLDEREHEVPHVIVSISTPGDNVANIKTNKHTLGMLRLVFDDADTPSTGWSFGYEADNVLMTKDHARQVLELVKTNPAAQRFIVHCDAGRSRSPAVAAALSKILHNDDSQFFNRYIPNMWVYRRILDVYNEEGYFSS